MWSVVILFGLNYDILYSEVALQLQDLCVIARLEIRYTNRSYVIFLCWFYTEVKRLLLLFPCFLFAVAFLHTVLFHVEICL